MERRRGGGAELPQPKICMFVYNAFVHDARVLRQASTLAGAGYDVRVLAALDSTGQAFERRGGFRTIRVDRDPRSSRAIRKALALLRRRRRGGDLPGARPGGSSEGRPGPYRWGTRLHSALGWLRFARGCARAARAEPAQVWVAHDLNTLPIAWSAKRRLGGRVLYDSHELFLERDTLAPETRLARWRWRAIESLLTRRADRVMTVNGSIAGELSRRYGIARPTVLLNAPARRSQPSARRDARLRAGLAPETRVALFVGGLRRNRGLENLIEAAAHLERCAIVFVGPGEPTYVASLEALAAANGVSGRIRFLGPVPPEAVTSVAAAADLGVVPTENVGLNHYYSLPNKLFEYIAAGLPIVGSRFPEFEAVIERHRVGRTCDPADPADIAAAIEYVLDPDRHEALRQNARAAAEVLNWEAEAPKLLRVLRELETPP